MNLMMDIDNGPLLDIHEDAEYHAIVELPSPVFTTICCHIDSLSNIRTLLPTRSIHLSQIFYFFLSF